MAHVIRGERAGKNGRLGVGTSAAVFDAERERILLIRRADNDNWAVPGGYMEPGESLTEGCEREVREETGLRVKVKRLISINTNPHLLKVYPDGNRWQLVVMHFEAEWIDGNLGTSDESSGVAFFSQPDTADLVMSNLDRLRVADSFAGQAATIIRDEF